MTTRTVGRFTAAVVTITGLFLSVSSVVASELLLPQQFTHDGPTFNSPLEISSGDTLPPVMLTFEEFEELDVVVPASESTLPKDQEVLAETIISPSPKTLPLTPPEPLADTITDEKTEPTPTPTKVPVTTPTPTPTKAPEARAETPSNTSLPSYATNGSLNPDVLFSMANQARTEAGLPPFEKHHDVCAVAESRKPEIENEVYGNSSIHAGFRARSLPWRASENMISRNTETEAFTWWMNSAIHRGGILGGSKYACVACQNKTCAMIFSSLDPK